MKEITEYQDSTSEYELFSHLHDKVMSREINTFSALKEYIAPIMKDRRDKLHNVVMKTFELVKSLNWGFFAGISLSTHKKIWRELVIPDPYFPEAGNLKRTISISNLYVAMLDIHGYTKFCQDSRKNLSMLHTLDRTINTEIRKISTQCSAVSQRERGDEIVVVAASATDAITATLSIIDYFSKTNIVNDPAISTQRSGDATVLPLFKITAGIAGGNTSIPLIVTEQGNLSGFLLNTGARLQARANELSPKESRIMITKQVYINYVKENSVNKSVIFKHNTVYFFDTGLIEFKGVMLPTCEVVFSQADRYKEKFSEEMNHLYAAVKESLWEQRIFSDLMEVIIKVVTVMPSFKLVNKKIVGNVEVTNNDAVAQLCRIAMHTYVQEEDYSQAVELLHEFIHIGEEIPGFDRLVLDYIKGVTTKYDMLLSAYNKAIDKQIDDKIGNILNGQNLKTYHAAKNAIGIYERLRKFARKSPEITMKKILWYNLIKQNKERMEFTLYSGKK